MRTGLWMIMIVLILAVLPSCNEAQQQTYGQGTLPENWQGFFGNSNISRLNFMQSRAIGELAERVRLLEAENPAELAERVRKLEGNIKVEDATDTLEEARKSGAKIPKKK